MHLHGIFHYKLYDLPRVFISGTEIMFSVALVVFFDCLSFFRSVCLSVSNIAQKDERFAMKFYRGVQGGRRYK